MSDQPEFIYYGKPGINDKRESAGVKLLDVHQELGRQVSIAYIHAFFTQGISCEKPMAEAIAKLLHEPVEDLFRILPTKSQVEESEISQ